MSWISRFFNKGMNPAEMRQMPPVNIGGYSFPDWKSGIGVEAFTTNATVYSVISLPARKAASIPWYVFQKKQEKGAKLSLERYKSLSRQGDLVKATKFRAKAYDDQEIVYNSPLSELIKRPNPNEGQDQFIERAFINRLLGECFIWMNRGITGGDVKEMYVLPTQFISIIPDTNDLYGVLGYQLDANGSKLFIPKEDVIHWRSVTPEWDAFTRTHLRGLSPLKAAFKTLLMDTEANKAGVAMYANGGAKGVLMPGIVGTSHANYTNEQATAIKDTVNRTVNSSEVRGAVAVFQSRWDYVNFGLSATDMDLLESMKLTREQFCQVFGVPAVLFSTDSMTDNNYQNAQRDLVTNLIAPMLATLRDEINRVLAFQETTFIDFDITALPELQRDFEKQVIALKSADWLTYDEKRMAIGYDPKGEEYDYSYVNSGLVKLEDLGIDLTVDPNMSQNDPNNSDPTQ